MDSVSTRSRPVGFMTMLAVTLMSAMDGREYILSRRKQTRTRLVCPLKHNAHSRASHVAESEAKRRAGNKCAGSRGCRKRSMTAEHEPLLARQLLLLREKDTRHEDMQTPIRAKRGLPPGPPVGDNRRNALDHHRFPQQLLTPGSHSGQFLLLQSTPARTPN